MIPKIIHTYWHSDIVPNFIRACINTWRITNPDYTIKIYSSTKFRKEFKNLPSNYDNLDIKFQSDCVRLNLLEKYGGIWINASTIIMGKITKLYINNNNVNGFFAPWGNLYLENWFIVSPPNHPLIKKWKKEHYRAIDMTFEKYKEYFIKETENIDISLRKDIQKIYNHLPYLTQHACYMRVNLLSKMKDSADMLDSIDGPYFYHNKSSWNINNTIELLYKNKYSSSYQKYPIIKLRGIDRYHILQYIEKKIVPKKNSIIDKFIVPYYKNGIIIRTHDPTYTMIDRIINTYNKCYDRYVIISLNISMESFNIQYDTDMFGYDTEQYNSEENLLNSLPKLIKNNTKCIVKYNDIYYCKNILNNYDRYKQHSKTRTLFSLKDNINKLINKFDTLHIYTVDDIFNRYDKYNFSRFLSYKNIAWNYHNECIALAVYDKQIYEFDNLWIMEDDIEYTGNIKLFMDKYEKYNFDLLGSRQHIDNRLYPSCNEKFISEMWKKMERKKYSEYIVCFSGRFLRNMLKLLYHGFHAHSEISTPIFCDFLKMKYLDIDNIYYSSQYYYKLVNNNTHQDIKKLVNKHKQNKDNVFIHPCKF